MKEMKFLPISDKLPSKSSTAEIKRAIDYFIKYGKSGPFVENGDLLHAICNHCIEAGIGFFLQYFPQNVKPYYNKLKGAYYIQRDVRVINCGLEVAAKYHDEAKRNCLEKKEKQTALLHQVSAAELRKLKKFIEKEKQQEKENSYALRRN